MTSPHLDQWTLSDHKYRRSEVMAEWIVQRRYLRALQITAAKAATPRALSSAA